MTLGKPLLKALGWILAIWGAVSIVYDLLVLCAILPADGMVWQTLFGSFQLIAVALILGIAELFAGIMALKWADDPDRAMALLSIGTTLVVFFILEAFFSWTQARIVLWGHLILGLIAGGLYCFAAWQNRD